MYRWSAIAAKLPGRTDNEIKNVWHTHLKKRVSVSKDTGLISNNKNKSKFMKQDQDFNSTPVTSPAQSLSNFSSSITETSSAMSGENTDSYGISLIKDESFSSEEFPIIDEIFWSEDLYMDNGNELNDVAPVENDGGDTSFDAFIGEPVGMLGSSNGDDMDFWLRVFIEAGEFSLHK